MLAAAMIPMVGVCAAAAAAATDDAHGSAASAPPSAAASAPQSPTQSSAPTRTNTPTSLPTRPAAGPTVAPVRADTAPLPASVTDGAVPSINYRAYKAAADNIARTQPACGIDWRLIAGIGNVESHHANNGDADSSGRLRDPIFGPTLDGSLAGNEVITDTDGGAIDGDPVHDRAVGPMQFIPATWKKYGADGNGDGVIDPQNVFDAALTTAHYLCDGGLNLRDVAGQTTAVLRYNNSMTYVSDVLGFAHGY